MMPERNPVTSETLLELQFIDAIALSPDGSRVVYQVRSIDPEKDGYESHLWLVPMQGGDPRRITFGEHKNGSAAWSPDGKTIAFVSDRRDKMQQIFRLSLDGGEAERLTDLDGRIGASRGRRTARRSPSATAPPTPRRRDTFPARRPRSWPRTRKPRRRTGSLPPSCTSRASTTRRTGRASCRNRGSTCTCWTWPPDPSGRSRAERGIMARPRGRRTANGSWLPPTGCLIPTTTRRSATSG